MFHILSDIWESRSFRLQENSTLLGLSYLCRKQDASTPHPAEIRMYISEIWNLSALKGEHQTSR